MKNNLKNTELMLLRGQYLTAQMQVKKLHIAQIRANIFDDAAQKLKWLSEKSSSKQLNMISDSLIELQSHIEQMISAQLELERLEPLLEL